MKSYTDFVVERHRIWEQRLLGLPAPWTDDPILASHSFTNVFRVLDYGSQYLLNMIKDEKDPEEVLFLCTLYRFTNRPEPWDYFFSKTLRYPNISDVFDDTLADVWSSYGQELRGSAYQITVGVENKGTPFLGYLTEWLLPALWSVMDDFINADSLEARVSILHLIPRCGPFMAMQIATDFGYWDPTFSENDYILPGPGAIRGAQLIDAQVDPVKLIHGLQHAWADEGTVTLAGRTPSLMDCQSTLCEFQKLERYSRLNQIGKYTPKHPQLATPYTPQHLRGNR